jgi:hypothetical protein
MLIMAKKGPKKMGRPRLSEARLAVQLQLSQELMDAFDQLARDNSRTRTAEVTLALQAHLRAAGRWPPKAPPAN